MQTEAECGADGVGLWSREAQAIVQVGFGLNVERFGSSRQSLGGDVPKMGYYRPKGCGAFFLVSKQYSFR